MRRSGASPVGGCSFSGRGGQGGISWWSIGVLSGVGTAPPADSVTSKSIVGGGASSLRLAGEGRPRTYSDVCFTPRRRVLRTLVRGRCPRGGNGKMLHVALSSISSPDRASGCEHPPRAPRTILSNRARVLGDCLVMMLRELIRSVPALREHRIAGRVRARCTRSTRSGLLRRRDRERRWFSFRWPRLRLRWRGVIG